MVRLGLRMEKPDAHGEVGTPSVATQIRPTFSRPNLGAGLLKKNIAFFKIVKEGGRYLLKSAYKLHYRTEIQGIPISIENRKGSIRRWYDPNEKRWGETKFLYPYGYIRMTEGEDGDHIDCFLGDNRESPHVFIIRQVNPLTKLYDEDKVMLGFDTMEEAVRAYQKHYDRPDFLGDVDYMTIGEFKEYLASRKTGFIITKSGRKNLVPKRVPINKNGKIYYAVRWVRAQKDGLQENIISKPKQLKKNDKTTSDSAYWRLVKTEKFKRWFGDWCSYKKLFKILSLKPLKVYNSLIGIESYKELRDIGKQHYSKLKSITKDGKKVLFPFTGFYKIKTHSADRRIMYLVPELPNLIEKSVFLWEEPDNKRRMNVIGYRHYGVLVNVQGEDMVLRIVLREEKKIFNVLRL